MEGKVPLSVRPIFFGANLFALGKKDGGVRPIAVGLTLRRMVAKIANYWATSKCSAILLPRQLGVGAKGGAEAISHAARQYLSNMDTESDCVMVKLDFTNAFNSIRRDCMIESVNQHIPELMDYVTSCYGGCSSLLFGPYTVDSAEGVQQGDPLGPLLFSLTINEALSSIQCNFVAGYLDDITMGGPIVQVTEEIAKFESSSKVLGLRLNYSKCEIIGLSPTSTVVWGESSFPFTATDSSLATLLGAPIGLAGIDVAIASQCSTLKLAIGRLAFLSSHEAIYLLKHSIAIPRLQYLLRTAPCFLSSELHVYDQILSNTIMAITNTSLDSTALSQASLPVRWGGIGIRSACALAPSAFISSLRSSEVQISLLLPERPSPYHDSLVEDAISNWRSLGGSTLPSGADALKQRCWDDEICSSLATSLSTSASANPVTKARLLACRGAGSGSWLHALPSANLGLRLSDDETRIAVGLRLGASLVLEHSCVCGSKVESDGHHGLACRKSSGRHLRHSLANDVIARALRSANTPTILEPTGMLRGDGKRPDGVTMIPWSRGKALVWDFTCPDTLAPSHVRQTSVAAGSAAIAAESKKRSKYAELSVAHSFVPFAIETLGVWGADAYALSSVIGSRIAAITGEPRSTGFLRQRLDIAVQRGNAAAILGTLPPNASSSC